MSQLETSVIIPVYDPDVRHFEQAIGSCLKQSFPESKYEIVVVNDGSTTDGAVNCVRGIREQVPRRGIRYIEQDNGGPAVAINTGIENARGKNIILLDADDILAPCAVALLSDALSLTRCVTAEKAGFDSRSGNVVYTSHKGDFLPKIDHIEDQPLLHANVFGHPHAFKKVALERAGGLNPAARITQDYDLVLKLVYGRDYLPYKVLSGLTLYWYRLHSDSLSSVNRAKQINEAQMVLNDTYRRLSCSLQAEYSGRNSLGLLSFAAIRL